MPRETVSLSGNLGECRRVVGFVARFWSKVKRGLPDECWEWQGSFKENGYPQLGVGSSTNGTRTMRMAHRLSYLIAHGHLPKGKFVLHDCDNKKCVNPQHLYLGTQKENVRDAVDRNRVSNGVNHTHAKLNPDSVRLARAMFWGGSTYSRIGESLGVSCATIKQVIAGETWRRVV